MKKLTLILQSKGGAGKSTLAYLLANKSVLLKNDKTVFFDLDNESLSSSKQLKFVNTSSYNLIDEESKHIDRTKLDIFIDEFIEQNEFSHAICDFGAASSQQFSNYLSDDGSLEIINDYMDGGELVFEIICVICGDNSFSSSMDYCIKLFENMGANNFKIFIAKNNFYRYSEDQNNTIEKVSKEINAEVFTFGILGNISSGALIQDIVEHMKNGESVIEKGKRSTQIRYKTTLKNLPYEFS